jgi:hypothetical protein
MIDDPPVAFGRNGHTGVGSTERREPHQGGFAGVRLLGFAFVPLLVNVVLPNFG